MELIIALLLPSTVARVIVFVVVVSIFIAVYSPLLEAVETVYSVPLIITFVSLILYCATLIITYSTSSPTVKLNEATALLVPSLIQELPVASYAGEYTLLKVSKVRV